MLIYTKENRHHPVSRIGTVLRNDRDEHKEEKLKASLWDNLPHLRHLKVFLGNFHKQTAKTMLELNRNKLRVLKAFLIDYCHHGKYRLQVLMGGG